MIKKMITIFILFFTGATLLAVNYYLEKPKDSTPIVDDQDIYVKDKLGIKELYLTIMPTNEKSVEYARTFNELNERKYEDLQIKVLFQEGKNGGSQPGYYGFGLTDANATMELRGQTSRRLALKSYKVKLNKKVGLWDGYSVINLNKHFHDPIKIRNKLNYDLFKNIPNFTSLRTQFVHVYIKDYSEGNYDQEFIDYGLFTQIENVDKDFLKIHGLDPKGWLYKAESFEFYRYSEELMLENEPDYQEKVFEDVLEIKGDKDHSKLISMLNDVNNKYIHINDVIDKHFNRENYITWLAVNILVGNIDTTSRNFFLYSPMDNDAWYFLPWDYDGTWGWYEKLDQTARNAPWQEGVSNYWGVVLHQRFLQNDKNREELTKKIEELSKTYIIQEKVKALVESYKPIVTEFLNREPDKLSPETINTEFERIYSSLDKNKKSYYVSLEKPMPVFMGKPSNLGDSVIFTWSESYDFQGETIEYILDISNSPEFDTVLFHEEGIKETEHVVNGLNPGHYFWRLTIKDSQGNTQTPFDVYTDDSGNKYFGIRDFLIN